MKTYNCLSLVDQKLKGLSKIHVFSEKNSSLANKKFLINYTYE